MRGDLIQFYKFHTGINIINWQIAPQMGNEINRKTRNSNQHSFQSPLSAKCQQRENFFIHRLISLWNALPQEVIQSETVNQFKNSLDKHLNKERPTIYEAIRLGKIIID